MHAKLVEDCVLLQTGRDHTDEQCVPGNGDTAALCKDSAEAFKAHGLALVGRLTELAEASYHIFEVNSRSKQLKTLFVAVSCQDIGDPCCKSGVQTEQQVQYKCCMISIGCTCCVEN